MKTNQQTNHLPCKIKLDGTGLYDSEAGQEVTVLKVTVVEGGVLAELDTNDLIYTDHGFEQGMNDLAVKLGIPPVGWSEQGMQDPENRIAHFDCEVSPEVVFEEYA